MHAEKQPVGLAHVHGCTVAMYLQLVQVLAPQLMHPADAGKRSPNAEATMQPSSLR